VDKEVETREAKIMEIAGQSSIGEVQNRRQGARVPLASAAGRKPAPSLGGDSPLDFVNLAAYIAAPHARTGLGARFDRPLIRRMGHFMRRLLPSGVEIAIFATLAVICAAVVAKVHPGTSDLGFAALAGPIFLVAACMGLRRSPAWTVAPNEDPSEESDEDAE